MSENDENYPEGFEAPGVKEPRADIDVNDIDRAERFIEFLDEHARYVPQFKKWFLWDGSRWAQDENDSELRQCAIEFCKERVNEANEIQEPKARQNAWMKAKLAGTRSTMEAMIDVAKSYPDICTRITDFDSNPLLFACDNGVVDLKTGEFRTARKEDLVWKRSPVAYDATATCPMWEEFLKQVLPQDEVVLFLQRACGYSMTAKTTEQVLFFLYGTGANGKSTFVDTFEKIMGDYSWRAAAKLFLDDRNTADPERMVAGLPEKRLVIGAEMSSAPLCETRVKDLTGGDTLVARKLWAEAFTFKPTHKLWFYGNDRPTVRNADEGIWRRMCLIPFEIMIPEEKRDRGILERLWSEAPGILNWMIRGCLEWQRQGLAKPQAVLMATAAYREEEDSIGEFIEEQCQVVQGKYVPVGKFYKAYTLWCEARGVQHPLAVKTFAARIRKIPTVHSGDPRPIIQKTKTRVWHNLVLTDPAAFQS